MATLSDLLCPLSKVGMPDVARVGGKAARLGQLIRAGFTVPPGVVLTVAAYERFLEANQLRFTIGMELGRKPLPSMRWEELWDAALRIRAAFARASMPPQVTDALRDAALPSGKLAVRSSAPAEDSSAQSFAGLHASVLDCESPASVERAVREVWGSLWSDAALLYRRELGLDPHHSGMAVVIQAQVAAPCSGVAFGLDPRSPTADRIVIEAVAGSCAGLVDGSVDPDRYLIERSSGRLLERRRGEDSPAEPLLGPDDLAGLCSVLAQVQRTCGWAADVEWTGRGEALTVLQARPAQAATAAPDDRLRYAAYCPAPHELSALSHEVTEVLIPELHAVGTRLANEEVEGLTDDQLLTALDARTAALEHWRAVYERAFIPFAHGVRVLGLLYNDALHPHDPHEFVGLLLGERFLATERNRVLTTLGQTLRADADLRTAVAANLAPAATAWAPVLGLLDAHDPALADQLRELLNGSLDVVFEGQRLLNRPDLLLGPLVVTHEAPLPVAPAPDLELRARLEARLLAEVTPSHRDEAQLVLDVARLAWRLRDDDNLLLGRVESQLLRAVEEATRRLRNSVGVLGRPPTFEDAQAVATALRSSTPLTLTPAKPAPERALRSRPRQLVGQPASPGIAQGEARCVQTAADLAFFAPGEVLVCDAIQPQMTHLVPLASAVIERRGGMLIHGAIIARELRIPCVNGVPRVTELLRDGDLVTVDGNLGLVTVGTQELPRS